MTRREVNKPRDSVNERNYAKSFLWWLGGFVSAIALLLMGSILMAGVVYSELPPKFDVTLEAQPVDVIVCLTGGKGRIRHALDLFEDGRGKLLYISGIDPSVQLGEILKELKWNGPVNESNIILENVATNTIENAQQVRKFILEKGIKSVLLVTSVYHVRRSNYIFRRILPQDTQLFVDWQESEKFDQAAWYKDWNAIFVTMSEFMKFFYAYLRIPSSI